MTVLGEERISLRVGRRGAERGFISPKAGAPILIN